MVTINGLSVTEFQLGLIIDALSDAAESPAFYDNENVAEQYHQLRRAFQLVEDKQGRTL
jgi:hypothetical protein